jgi:hypothetical protein
VGRAEAKYHTLQEAVPVSNVCLSRQPYLRDKLEQKKTSRLRGYRVERTQKEGACSGGELVGELVPGEVWHAECREVGGGDVLFFTEAQLTADMDLFQGCCHATPGSSYHYSLRNF